MPGETSFFFASLAVSVRFGVAALVVAALSWRILGSLTRLEWSQGLGLAFFGGCGIVLQMDGLAHTSASTAAFLTQFYCLLIPIWAAWRLRIVPRFAVILSLLLVLAGVAVLAGISWTDLKIGRGEAEILVAATFFAAQILWLERPRYAGNRVMGFTVIMFAGTALLVFPIALATASNLRSIPAAYSSGPAWLVMGSIILFCTLGAYLLMNRWQRFVTATEAGLIYCVEPLAASLFAVVMPAWLSGIAGIDYENERLTARLIVGGTLITAANVLIQFEAMRKQPAAAPVAG